ncbi:MAG: hypothetical protein IKN92_06095 [Clostridia bacterium]|nr:hypothetical protein [Clostridia bacterium]
MKRMILVLSICLIMVILAGMASANTTYTMSGTTTDASKTTTKSITPGTLEKNKSYGLVKFTHPGAETESYRARFGSAYTAGGPVEDSLHHFIQDTYISGTTATEGLYRNVTNYTQVDYTVLASLN